MDFLRLLQFVVPDECHDRACQYPAKQFCETHQDLCCTTCACRMHVNCTFEDIPDPKEIKNTLHLLHKQLIILEKEGQKRDIEFWNKGYTEDLKKHQDEFAQLLPHFIEAFKSNDVGELIKVEKLILPFKTQLESSECKSQLALHEFNRSTLPFMYESTEAIYREKEVAERVFRKVERISAELVAKKDNKIQKLEAEMLSKYELDTAEMKDRMELGSEQKIQEAQQQLDDQLKQEKDTCQQKIQQLKDVYEQKIQETEDICGQKIQQACQDADEKVKKAEEETQKIQVSLIIFGNYLIREIRK